MPFTFPEPLATFEPRPAILHRGPDLPPVPVQVCGITTRRVWIGREIGEDAHASRAMAMLTIGTVVGLRRIEWPETPSV